MSPAGAIRERAPNGGSPFIVALTANALVSEWESYLRAGMDDYLSKPITDQALLASLRGAAHFRGAASAPPAAAERSIG